MTTKDIEEIVEEFDKEFSEPLCWNAGNVHRADWMECNDEIKDWLRTTLTTLLTQAEEEKKRAVEEEKTEINEAIKKLAKIADFNYVTGSLRTSATYALQAKYDYDKSRYIEKLREKIVELSNELQALTPTKTHTINSIFKE